MSTGLTGRIAGRLPPRSPYGLVQEDLYPDEWLCLVACMMLNCTARRQVERILPEFVRRWPTPNALIEADEAAVAELCRPLGFANRRTKNIRAMTEAYLSGRHAHARELPGIGEYGARAWEIFFTGSLGDVPPNDHALVRYYHWARAQGHEHARSDSAERKKDPGEG